MSIRTPLIRTALWAALALTGASTLAQVAPPVPPASPEGVRPGPGPMGHPGAHGPRGPMGGAGPHRPGHERPGHERRMHGGGAGMMLLGPGLDRALEVAKASPEQRAEIRKIAGAARDDLRAARRNTDPMQARAAFMAAWSADQVDAAALERQRQQRSAQQEAVSRRMTQAMVDIGKILRPEQRRALAEHWRAQRPAHRRAELDFDGEHAQSAAD